MSGETTLGTTQISAAPPPASDAPFRTKRVFLKEFLRRVVSNDVIKIIVLLLMFSWFPLQPVIWRNVGETDVWWHMRTGEWILQHHQLPHTDPFSSTGVGKPWVAYSWPFEIFIYEVAKQWDLIGIVAVTVFLWVGMTAVLLHLIRGFKPPFWASVTLALLGSIVFMRVCSSRPGPLTVIFFIVVLDILLDAERNHSVRKLWAVPIIVWIWANLHVQFVYGLFVIGLFCMLPVFDWALAKLGSPPEPGTRHLPAKWMWGTLALSTAVTFANAYGVGIYRVLWDFIQQPKLYSFINETRAMAFNLRVHFIVLFVALAAAAALGRQRRIQPLWAILLAWAAVSGFHAERDIWVTGVISICILAQWAAIQFPNSAPVERRVWLGAFACVLLMLIARFKTGPTNKELSALWATELPVGAVAYIHEHHLQGPIYNNFDWGGFLIYALPEMPVVIDGRTNVHGQDEIARSLETWNVKGDDWYDDPLLQKANLVIADPFFSLTYVLRKDPHFKVVFEDTAVVLYQRVLPPDSPSTKPTIEAKKETSPK